VVPRVLTFQEDPASNLVAVASTQPPGHSAVDSAKVAVTTEQKEAGGGERRPDVAATTRNPKPEAESTSASAAPALAPMPASDDLYSDMSRDQIVRFQQAVPKSKKKQAKKKGKKAAVHIATIE